jgi:hypothetical protein
MSMLSCSLACFFESLGFSQKIVDKINNFIPPSFYVKYAKIIPTNFTEEPLTIGQLPPRKVHSIENHDTFIRFKVAVEKLGKLLEIDTKSPNETVEKVQR